MKSNQTPNPMVPFLTTKNPIIPFPPTTTHTSASQKKHPFLSEGRMEEELLDRSTNTPSTNKVKAKLLQKRAPHSTHVLAIPKEMIKVFLRFPTKQSTQPNGPTSRVLLTSPSTVLTR